MKIPFPKDTLRLTIPAEAMTDLAGSASGLRWRTVRCLNLRPDTGADGEPVLRGMRRPLKLCDESLEPIGVLPAPGGKEAIVLSREPELYCLLPEESEPRYLGVLRGAFLCATLCGHRLLICDAEGTAAVEWKGNIPSYGRVPRAAAYHGISLRAQAHTVISASVAPRRLSREYASGEVMPDDTDVRRLSGDLLKAYADICGAARAQGCFLQPVLARYRVYDADMHELYCSAPVLLSHPQGQQSGSRISLRSTDRRKVESYSLAMHGWRIVADIPQDLPAEAAFLSVWVSEQFHPCDPSGTCAMSLGRGGDGDGEFGRISLPGDYIMDEFNSAGAISRLSAALARLDRVEHVAASYGLGASGWHITVESGAASDYQSEVKTLEKALALPPEPADRLSVLSGCPDSFTAARVCAGPGAVLWGDIRSLRYGGYPLGMFAATVSDKSWTGWIKVVFAGGKESVVWSGGGASGAPATLTPLLSYPSADAVSMIIGLKVQGEDACENVFSLTPDPALRHAVYVHESLRPFTLSPADDGQTAVPSQNVQWVRHADTLALAPLSSPLALRACLDPGKGRVNALAPAGGSQSAWDFGRPRFYAFCSGGILAVNGTQDLGRLAATPVDSRVCAGPRAVTVADGTVWSVASGDLIRMQANKAVTVCGAYGCESVAWCARRRELIGLRSDGSIMFLLPEEESVRFEADFRLGSGSMFSPHGGRVLFASATGIYDLGEDGGGAMLDAEWTVDFSDSGACATRMHAMACDFTAAHFSGTVSVTRRNHDRVAPRSDFSLRISGKVQSPVGARIVARPATGWRFRMAGNISDTIISKIIFLYERLRNN